MSKHKITVIMPVEVTFTVNDEHRSDWDGKDLMHVHENGERWATGQPVEQDVALRSMAAQIIDRGRLGGTDGWADFPDEAATPVWCEYLIDQADIIVEASDD